MQNDSPISLKMILYCFLSSVIVLSFLTLINLLNTHTKVVFCNADKGSAVYIRVKNRTDVLLNVGPDKRILDCLGKEMPFFDRTVEYVFLLSMSQNYIGGMQHLVSHYKIKELVMPTLYKNTKATDELNIIVNKFRIKYGDMNNVHTISILNSVISITSVNLISKYYYAVKYTDGFFTSLFLGHLTANDLKNYLSQDKGVVRPRFYVVQLPSSGLNSKLNIKFFSLADGVHVVINLQSTTVDQTRLTELKNFLESKGIMYYKSNDKKYLKFTFN
ncbi:MAG: hypothetical protein ABIO02_01100 [Patescibacteria group bacterium]